LTQKTTEKNNRRAQRERERDTKAHAERERERETNVHTASLKEREREFAISLLPLLSNIIRRRYTHKREKNAASSFGRKRGPRGICEHHHVRKIYT
jgi:hypothetical protein